MAEYPDDQGSSEKSGDTLDVREEFGAEVTGLDVVLKRTLHIEGAGVDGSWLPAGVSSVVSGILVTRCGGVHLRTHANGEKLKSVAPPSN